MASSTIIAVVCAIGVPAVIAIVAVSYFWNRQQRKMRREMAREAKNSEFGSNSSDLDLDNIIEEEDTTESGPSGLNRSSDSSSTTEIDLERQSDGGKFQRSGTKNTKHGNPARSRSRMYGQPRIKGLRIVPRIPNSQEGGDTTSSSGSTSYGPHKLGSRSNTEQGSSSTDANGKITESYNRQNSTRADRERNFINYYESVIPILPTAAEASTSSSTASSSNLLDAKNKQTGLDRPLVPGSHDRSASSLSGQRSLLSVQSEYRRQLNQTDSSSFPKAAQTMATATASQINLLNNYPVRNGTKLSSSPVSRSNSSFNIANTGTRDARRFVTSSQRLISPHGGSRNNSSQSLGAEHQTPKSYSENSQHSSSTSGKRPQIATYEHPVPETSDYESSPESRDPVTPQKPLATHQDTVMHTDDSHPAKRVVDLPRAVGFDQSGIENSPGDREHRGRQEQNLEAESSARRSHISPFETPMRKSQFMAADDDADDNVSDSSSFSYREPRSAAIDSDQFSNYSSNKRAWLQSVKQGL